MASKALIPFNKITNCFLIIHPLVTRMILLSSDGSIHLSIGLIVSTTYGIYTHFIFVCLFVQYVCGFTVCSIVHIHLNTFYFSSVSFPTSQNNLHNLIEILFIQQLTMYLGFAITTIFCSFLLYIVLEAPVEQLLRLIYNKNMK